MFRTLNSVSVTIDGRHVTVTAAGDVTIDGHPWDTDAALNAFDTTPSLAVLAAHAVATGELTLADAVRGAHSDLDRPSGRCADPAVAWYLIHLRPNGPRPVLDVSPANLSPGLAALFADSPDRVERVRAARAAACPAEVLGRLAHDQDLDVRAGVAANPFTPAPVLLALASDSSALLRATAASNPTLPTALRTQLAGDENRTVRRAARAGA